MNKKLFLSIITIFALTSCGDTGEYTLRTPLPSEGNNPSSVSPTSDTSGDITPSSSPTPSPTEESIKDESVFDEPYLSKQYYLNRIGDIYRVWENYRGKGVTIAVIDSAFDPYHEDFTKLDGNSKISSKSASFSYNGASVSKNVGISYVRDLSDSHGTFCAGVAGAALNHKGVIGIAPDAELMLLKVDKKPKSICEAFKYAADNGAKVITISIGSYYNYYGDLINDGSDLSTVFNDSITYCRNKGVVVCSAAGNGGQSQPNEYTFPGAVNNVIGCGGLAFDDSYEIWSGSSYNSSSQYQFVDVFAPSENMFGICNYQKQGQQVLYEGGWEGTSFSSPIVAGLAALYFEKYPNNSVLNFETALFNSCHSITTSKIATANQLGYGRIDALKLMGISDELNVNIKVKSNLNNLYVYAWNNDLTLDKELTTWPGVKLTKENNYFSYTLKASTYDLFILNDGSNNNKSIGLLSSSFIDGYTYDISSLTKERSLIVGSFTK